MHQWNSDLPSSLSGACRAGGAVRQSAERTGARRPATSQRPTEGPEEWHRRLWQESGVAAGCFILACLLMRSGQQTALAVSGSSALFDALLVLIGTAMLWSVLERLKRPVPLSSPAKLRGAALCLVATMAAAFGPCAWFLVLGR